jgi:hypothetical protein
VLEPYVFILAAIGLLLFVWGQEAILTGLIVSSVLQAMAFINISDSPIIAYYFFGALFIVRALIDLLRNPQKGSPENQPYRPLIWLFAFTTLSILGAFFLPQIFTGTLVYSPKLAIDEQFYGLSRLVFTSSHANQALQLLVNAMICAIIWLRRIPPAALVKAIFVGFYVEITIALWQLASNTTGIYFPAEWLYTAKGWSLGDQQKIGSFSRINGSFIEPSLLATYLMGFFGFLLIWWVRRPSWQLLLGLLAAIFVMLTTTSSTAYFGLLLITLAVLVGLGFFQLINGGWVDKTLLMILLAMVIIIWLSAMLLIGFGDVRELFNLVLLQKSEGDSFRVRIDADLQSLQILWQTYGLGVGLGSNRPSSFLTFLLSNVGVAGFVLFVMFVVSLSKSALRTAKESANLQLFDWSIAALWGLWTTIVAKVISQPDLSYSPMWVWIFLLISLGAANVPSTLRTSSAPNSSSNNCLA